MAHYDARALYEAAHRTLRSTRRHYEVRTIYRNGEPHTEVLHAPPRSRQEDQLVNIARHAAYVIRPRVCSPEEALRAAASPPTLSRIAYMRRVMMRAAREGRKIDISKALQLIYLRKAARGEPGAAKTADLLGRVRSSANALAIIRLRREARSQLRSTPEPPRRHEGQTQGPRSVPDAPRARSVVLT